MYSSSRDSALTTTFLRAMYDGVDRLPAGRACQDVLATQASSLSSVWPTNRTSENRTSEPRPLDWTLSWALPWTPSWDVSWELSWEFLNGSKQGSQPSWVLSWALSWVLSCCDPSDHLQESPGPKSQKSLKKSLFGGPQTSPRKYPKRSKIPQIGLFGVFF